MPLHNYLLISKKIECDFGERGIGATEKKKTVMPVTMKEEGEWVIIDEEKWMCLDLVVEERDEDEMLNDMEKALEEAYALILNHHQKRIQI